MQKWIGAFEGWYLKDRATMKLSWHYKVGECTVRGTYGGNKTFDFVMLPIHAMVLSYFNTITKANQELSFDDIMEGTRINEVEVLKRILHSFVCPNPVLKTQILIKIPPSNSIQETDKFKINAGFSNPKRRVGNICDCGDNYYGICLFVDYCSKCVFGCRR